MIKYERLSAEFCERGLTNDIKHYVSRIPELCHKIKMIKVSGD